MSGETSDGPGGGASTGRRQRAIVAAATKPSLPRYVKLRHDATRDKWLIQAPERSFYPDPIAVEVLKLCDGKRTVAEVADLLAMRYTAPKEQILADIVAMLQKLADKGVIGCAPTNLH
jgi:pyrroloquinoline quinone biosynthesis protein D